MKAVCFQRKFLTSMKCMYELFFKPFEQFREF